MAWFRRSKDTEPAAARPRKRRLSNVSRLNRARGKQPDPPARPANGPISNDEFITRYGDPFD